ncbi:MAG: DUF599 family protein, partial [Brevundimonas sp.]
MPSISLPDSVGIAVFAVAWLAYEPLLKRLSRGQHLNSDMTVVRRAWMMNMAGRENRFLDSQLMGHVINSASFFASANLIIIAAAAGALFGGDNVWRSVRDIAIIDRAPRWLFDAKLAVIILALSRGLLDFIWSLRQMNYCIAAFGAAPERADRATLHAYGAAVTRVLNPAVSSFNAGVRGYYFALAGAA